MNITDVHTHNLSAGPDAIINIEPDRPAPLTDSCRQRFSTGVHPWRTAEADTLWPLVADLAADPRVAAIGECGIDRLRGGDIDVQRRLFIRHARLAEQLRKPLIIHCVRAWAELLAANAEVRPTVPWIVHGFRGGPALARQLLDAGMHISLGERFNPEAAAAENLEKTVTDIV